VVIDDAAPDVVIPERTINKVVKDIHSQVAVQSGTAIVLKEAD
jgi:hypothetical protein